MNFLQQLFRYIQRDFSIEWKNKSIIGSSIVYLISVIFICMHAFEQFDPDVWNALFWIVMMFSVLTVAGRSFQNETGELFLYHYHLAKPEIIVTAKLLLNGIYSIFLSLVAYLFFSIFLGNQIQNSLTMFVALLLGGSGLGFLFTLTSGLSARSSGNLVLTSILSLPILLPLIIIVVQLTERAFANYNFQQNLKLFAGLFLLNVIIIAITYVLFPYLWRD